MRITFCRELADFYPLPDELVSVAKVIFISDKCKRISIINVFYGKYSLQYKWYSVPLFRRMKLHANIIEAK